MTDLLTISETLNIDLEETSFIMRLIAQRPGESFDFYKRIITKHIQDIQSHHYILIGLCIGVNAATEQMQRQISKSLQLCQRKN